MGRGEYERALVTMGASADVGMGFTLHFVLEFAALGFKLALARSRGGLPLMLKTSHGDRHWRGAVLSEGDWARRWAQFEDLRDKRRAAVKGQVLVGPSS